jgi:hypothetical protein
MTKQARFGGVLDDGHEAAVYRNKNITLALLWPVTCVVQDIPKDTRIKILAYGPF